MKKNKSVVLITSGQPSVNPRLVKEADALCDSGFNVTVIYQYWNSWATELDKELLKTKKWKAIRVGGGADREKYLYLFSRLLFKLLKFLYYKLGGTGLLPELAISRTSFFLLLAARRSKADLYIGHNLGALPATVLAAKRHNKPCGFDAEDFHRYETNDDDNDKEVQLKKYLESKYIPQLNYLSAASPLIAKEYNKLFPNIPILSILNVFSYDSSSLATKPNKTKHLKLFWFSQTIGTDRGLENVIKAIGLLNNPNFVELHLLGSISSETRSSFSLLFKEVNFSESQVFFYEPIGSEQIIKFASKFDIGLATETGIPKNRDICLTNKIFTYIQAGLAILASDTSAQKLLLSEHQNLGFVYQNDNIESLKNMIETYILNPHLLDLHKQANTKVACQVLNWDVEKLKFVKQVNDLI